MSSAYVLIFGIIWLILAGATAFPLRYGLMSYFARRAKLKAEFFCSLRFFVWLGTKIFKHGSTAKGLRFLLRHPRR